MKSKLLLILSILIICLTRNSRATCTLIAPVITSTTIKACQITIKWQGDASTAYYKVRYKLKGSSAWISSVNVNLTTTYTFTNLNGNTKYVVSVIPYCSNNQPGPNVQAGYKTASCSQPFNIEVSSVTSSSAKISWTLCGSSGNSFVRYRKTGAPSWTIVSAGAASSVTLNSLTPASKYKFQVNSCDTSNTSQWTAIDTFKTHTQSVSGTKPNVLIILLDDCRYDVFGPTGGPSWFSTPAIDRIANEGANFRFTFPATSLCSPSRASIMSGLYPHHHGVFGGDTTITSFSPTTLAEIMQNNGYYTGFVGKYGYQKFPIPGYNYYCESSTDDYFNAVYDYNGQFGITIPGHKTDVFTDKALEFLNQVPQGQPFCLFLYHKAPHFPYDVRPQDANLFTTDVMPTPSNFYEYSENYPSYYYDCNVSNEAGLPQLSNNIRNYYRMIAGTEWSVDTVMQYLDNHNLTDSTLIIFTSDNGLMKGEHKKDGKGIALEESIKLPMFIRYPKWFAPNTVIDSAMAMNIDIAPTVLDAAGIPNTFNMDGVSMRALANNSVQRKDLFYEYFWYGRCIPTMQAIRDYKYKYITNGCDQVTNEFYDLTADPHENTNLINSSSYASLIALYQNKLDSLSQLSGYINLSPTINDCQINNPVYTNPLQKLLPDDSGEQGEIYPNPASNEINVVLHGSSSTTLLLRDISSHTILKQLLQPGENGIEQSFDISGLPEGVYFVELINDQSDNVFRFVKQ